MMNFVKFIIFIVGPLFLILNLVLFNISVNGVKYDPVPFDNIPVAKINSGNDEYRIGADFSIDYGDETSIKQDNDPKQVNSIILNTSYNGTSLELECDSDDRCGTSLAPWNVDIYLVNRDIADEQILNYDIPILELANNDCGTESIKNCANFHFSIPSDILVQNYTLVLEMSFDEAKWIFINPVSISK